MAEYNIACLLEQGEEKFAREGYIYEKHGDEYVGKTFGEFVSDVRSFASLLINKGLYGANIGLYGPNSYAYMAADVAIMGYVGTCVALSKEWKEYDVANAINKIELRAVVYDPVKEKEICSLKNQHPKVLFISLDELGNKADLKVSLSPRKSDDCAKIVFSSGTTGMPKAVMLSQTNMFANRENLHKRAPLCNEDICYLFLPLSHVYGGICVFLYSLVTGMKIYLCSDVRKMFDELREVKPTVFCAVPLIYEKAYSFCTDTDADPKDVFGGRIRYLFSGGAFLRPEIRRFIKERGLNLLHSYGLSETSSIVCVEYSNKDDFDSVGTIFENTDVRILNPDENGEGEILVRGDSVFQGYYNADAGQTFDSEGYFHTGDTGRIEENKIYLCGRKKRIILMSNGENVYPDEIEQLLMEYEEIVKAKVFEKDRKIFAQIYIKNAIDIDSVISDTNAKLPGYSTVSDYEVFVDSVNVRLK